MCEIHKGKKLARWTFRRSYNMIVIIGVLAEWAFLNFESKSGQKVAGEQNQTKNEMATA